MLTEEEGNREAMAVVDHADDEEGEAPLGDLVGGIHPDDDGAIPAWNRSRFNIGMVWDKKVFKWKYKCLLSHHASLLRGLMD